MPDHIDYTSERLRWRRRIAQEIGRETPYQWAQRLLAYAEELANIEPHMAMTMRVCGVLLEQSRFYNSMDMRRGVAAAQDQLVDDCLFVVRNLVDQGADEEARGALEVAKHLAGIDSMPVPHAAPRPKLSDVTPRMAPKMEPEVTARPKPIARSVAQPQTGPAGPLQAELRQRSAAMRSFPD